VPPLRTFWLLKIAISVRHGKWTEVTWSHSHRVLVAIPAALAVLARKFIALVTRGKEKRV
jgi:hypothetical protein